MSTEAQTHATGASTSPSTPDQFFGVLEYPGSQDHLYGEMLQGPPGQFLKAALEIRKLNSYSVIPRIACFPSSIRKRQDRVLRRAAQCCLERCQEAIHQADPTGAFPRLYVGKYSTLGLLDTHQWTLPSGETKKIPLAKLSKDIPFQGVMTIDHPRVPSWYKTPSKPTWYAALSRFRGMIQGTTYPNPPTPLTEPSRAALEALHAMGPVIGWDVETLGVDPLTAPITCIGISDGERTVVQPWDAYDTARHGQVPGLCSHGQLGFQIQQMILNLLASDRIQVTQNGTYDTLAMNSRGFPGRNDFDILHAHKILWPEIPASLEAIGVHLVSRLPWRWKTIFRAGADDDAKGSDVYRDSAAHDLRWYCGLDAWVTRMAYGPLAKLLATKD